MICNRAEGEQALLKMPTKSFLASKSSSRLRRKRSMGTRCRSEEERQQSTVETDPEMTRFDEKNLYPPCAARHSIYGWPPEIVK